jgi:hypothetical protein
MNQHITVQPLVYNGEVIQQRDEMLSLTDMWRAAGSPPNREPFNWARFEGAAFLSALCIAHNLSEAQVMVSKRGKGGGTFAHWQGGLAYAQYLNPDFHRWCNEVVRERMEGKSVAVATLPPEVLEMIRRDDGISRMLSHKVTGIESTVQALVTTVSAIAAIMRPPGDGIYVTGRSAGEIWKAAGFPPIRVTCWFSNRLVKMGCQMDDGRRIPVGLGRAKLFDPDKAENWLRNGGRKLVEEYISQRQGQGRLRLVAASASPAH